MNFLIAFLILTKLHLKERLGVNWEKEAKLVNISAIVLKSAYAE